VSRPDAGRCFTEALQAELDRYQAAAWDEPGEPDEAGPVPASPTAREFARALREALAAEREPDDSPGAADTPRPASPFEKILWQHLDPISAAATGPAQTTEQSGWITDTCPVCRHSFRQGEMVWLEERDGQIKAVHAQAELPCHTGGEPRQGPAVLTPPVAIFLDAFRKAYPAIPGVAVKRLRPGHPLLSGQYRERSTCAGCNHTFRPFERVAFCPCSPDAPACRLAAHRDPAASLLCFDALANPARKHCPMDYHKLGGPSHGRALCQACADPRLGPAAA
jgi:hypothetical protein